MTAMFFEKQLATMTAQLSHLVTPGGYVLIHGSDFRIELQKGDHLKLRSASGARLTSIDGTAWITVDREPSDVLIPAGDSFVVPSDRSVLVGPVFGAATLDLQGTPRTVADAVTHRCATVSKTRIG
jgi:hypothetical protein